MENLIYILFIALVAPLILMLQMLRKRSRVLVGYMIIGIFVSLFVSELNTILLGLFDKDMLYVTTTITPISEEIAKAAVYLLSKEAEMICGETLVVDGAYSVR